MSKNPKPISAPPSKDEVTRQLERLLTSPDIRITPQQTAMLQYVVNQTLTGMADRIRGYTVATEVLGRREDFDQNLDPIVSIQAARLRRALAEYYRGPGRQDPLRIDIPKGTYVPEFIRRQTQSTAPATLTGNIDVALKSNWPAVILKPLRNISSDHELDYWGIGLATELAHELDCYPDIRVMTLQVDSTESAIDSDVDQFIIGGSVRRDSNVIKMTVQLTALKTGRMVWSESYRLPSKVADLFACQEEIARSIAVKIAGEHGHIAKTLMSRIKRCPPTQMTTYEAVLHYYEYDSSHSPEAFSRALTALENAVRIDPECGQVWSMLARLYVEIHSFDIPGFQDPLATALTYAYKGVRLSPEDQRARGILALTHLMGNDLAEGRAAAEQALSLNPESIFMLDAIGYLITLLGDWERGPALIRKVIQLNPFYKNYVHYALWVDCLRKGDNVGAREETLKLCAPASFWTHLARAATLGLLGQIEDGRRSAAELLKLKPDFDKRGRFLIQCYIKFEELVERVVEGLGAVGVTVR